MARYDTIGKASCLSVLCFCTDHRPHKAGVVRVQDGDTETNKVVVVEMQGDSIIRVVPPHDHLEELDRNPAFSCWPMASLDEAEMIIAGEIPTYTGASLGDSMRDYLGMGG